MIFWLLVICCIAFFIACVCAVVQFVQKRELDMYCRFLEYENSCFRAELKAVNPNHEKLGKDNE